MEHPHTEVSTGRESPPSEACSGRQAVLDIQLSVLANAAQVACSHAVSDDLCLQWVTQLTGAITVRVRSHVFCSACVRTHMSAQ